MTPPTATSTPRTRGEALAAPARRLSWRLLRDGPLAGARNMALDHALSRCLREGEGVLRLYGWRRPTVSFGRNEPARGLYSGAADVDFVRRPTGGRAVVHWRELTYAVVAPVDAWRGPRAAYGAINAALAGALCALGAPVAVEASSGARALGPDAGPCFQSPAPGEVAVGGRKLVGSAQARLEGAMLQHGSILLDDDQGRLPELLTAAGTRPAGLQPPATLRELAGDVGIDALTGQVAKSLRETFGGTWAAGGYRPEELAQAEVLERERYACGSWTWRR